MIGSIFTSFSSDEELDEDDDDTDLCFVRNPLILPAFSFAGFAVVSSVVLTGISAGLLVSSSS